MKRDIDLIKEILIEIEKSDDPFGLSYMNFPGRNENEISYHVNFFIRQV